MIRALSLTVAVVASIVALSSAQAVTPPKGFAALYNGKDLSGWRGGDTFDHRRWLAMPEADRATREAEWTADMRAHWSADGAELVNDGKGKYATTVREYGDFELLVDYKTVPLADSGIYLRGVPQVQIWDHTNPAEFKNGAEKGSGGLWNNSRGAPGKDPLVLADKPFGEWNHFRIVMVARSRQRLAQRQAGRRSRRDGELLRPQGARAGARSHLAADARRRDPLAQHLHSRDWRARGERDPRERRQVDQEELDRLVAGSVPSDRRGSDGPAP